MKTKKAIWIVISMTYLSVMQASLAECPGSPSGGAEPMASSTVSGMLANQTMFDAMFSRSYAAHSPATSQGLSRAPTSPSSWSGAPRISVMPYSGPDGRISTDNITLDANQTFKDMLAQPLSEPTFEQDVAAILTGNKPMVQAQCQCKYEQVDGGQIQDDGVIVAFGASAAIAKQNAMRSCFQDAYTAEAGSLDLKHHSVDALWSQVGHVQSVDASQCTISQFKLDLNFLANYKKQHHQDLLQTERALQGQRSLLGKACFNDHFQGWASNYIAILNGGWSWRARGGAIPTGNDNVARIGFGFIPMVLTSCIAAKDMRGFADGMVMAGLMTAPLYYSTYSHIQGAGGETSCNPNSTNHGTLGSTNVVCSGSVLVDNVANTAAVSEYGYQMETFLAMAYAKWRGYDPSYLAMAGLAWGPCAALFNASHINDTWFNRESCWGAANHLGIAMTLEKGQIKDVDNNGPSDLFKDVGPEAQQFAKDLQKTLDNTAITQDLWNTPDVSNWGQNPIPH